MFLLASALLTNHVLWAHEHHQPRKAGTCGTPPPLRRQELVDHVRLQHAFEGPRQLQRGTRCSEICERCVEIKVYLHLIEGDVTGYGPLIPHPTDAVLDLLEGDKKITSRDFSTEQDVVAMFHVFNASLSGREDSIRNITYLWKPKLNIYYVAAKETMKKSLLTKVLAICTPGAFNADRTCICQNLG